MDFSAYVVQSDGVRARKLRRGEFVLVACGIVGLIIFFQIRLGAYQAEFGDDSASHYISGLLIHDYLAAGLPGAPVDFVRRFHSSYPLVGIGHWGPLFYIVQGAWMLGFGWGRASMLLLSAGVTVLIALTLYSVAARRFGSIVGAFTAVAFVASPIAQQGSAELMLDSSIALLCLLALVAYSLYLDTGRAVHSLAFGLLAATGLLIKGNAGCLALLPVFAMAISRDWHVMRRWTFWLPAMVVAVLAGPWYLLTYGQVAPGFRYHWGWDFISIAVPANLSIMTTALGPLLPAAGVAGLVGVWVRPRRYPGDNLMVAAASLFAAVLTFQSVVPAAIQDRYLEAALPPLLLLAGYAARLGTAICFEQTHKPAGAIVFGLLCLAALPWTLDVAPKRPIGLIEAAHEVWQQRVAQNPSVLIVAEGAFEGPIIAELAMDDPLRPSLFAVRGSRLLGGGGYNTSDYLQRFESPQAVAAAIDSYAIPLVLIRSIPGHNKWKHIDQVQEARALQPDHWDLLYQDHRDGAQIELYRISDNAVAHADADRLRSLSAPRALDPAH